MLFCRKIKDQSNSGRFCNISVKPGDHAPFLETHGYSVRLGRSASNREQTRTQESKVVADKDKLSAESFQKIVPEF